MSQREQLVSSAEQITALCFKITSLAFEEEKAVSTPLACISSSEPKLNSAAPAFVPKKEKEKVGDTVYVTPSSSVRSGYVGALTNPKRVVVSGEGSSSVSSDMAAHGWAGGNTVAAYLAAWNAAPDEATQINLEADAMQHGITAVKFEAVNQRDTRNQNRIQQLAAALNTANAAITIANANATAALAVATSARHNVFKACESSQV